MTSLVDDKIEQLRTRAQREIDEELLPSCQFALALDGDVVVAETYGDAPAGARYVIFSATKPVVASTVWVLMQEGGIDVSRRVVDYVPEFGTFGKDVITVEQVMLHTSGFPRAPLGAPMWFTREGRLQRFAEWKLNWEPGTRYEYHPTSAHWVLAEIVERVTGRDYRVAIRELVLDKLGLDRLQVGVPTDQQGDIQRLEERGQAATPEEIKAVFGIEELPPTEVTDEALMGFNDPRVRELGVPGGGGVSDAGSLALFYQELLHNTRGVWSPQLLEDVTSRVRNTLPDRLLGHPAMRTLGLVTAGDDGKSNLRGMGRTVSPRAFGHNGAAGQIAWADPATGLSFVYLTNGIDKHMFRQARRGVALSSIAATCTVATPTSTSVV